MKRFVHDQAPRRSFCRTNLNISLVLFSILVLTLLVSPLARAAGPIAVADRDDLAAIANNLSGHYVLTQDIDLSDDPWTPLGTFKGILDGNGHKIAGLTIAAGSNYTGLFKELEGAIVRNLTLENVDVHSSAYYVGAIAGRARNNSLLLNVYVHGSVSGGRYVGGLAGQFEKSEIRESTAVVEVSAEHYLGGFVGQLGSSSGGSVISSSHADATILAQSSRAGGLAGHFFGGAIRDSYARGQIKGGASRVGGLVGAMRSGSIVRTYASGDVAGSTRMGGLVGQMDAGQLRDSYARVDVTGSSYIGGIVGIANLSDPDRVRQVYAAGSVKATRSAGCVVGENSSDGKQFDDIYWDKSLCALGAQSSGPIGDNVLGLTTSEMQGAGAQENMTALEFGTSWQVVEGDYPALIFQAPEPIVVQPIPQAAEPSGGGVGAGGHEVSVTGWYFQENAQVRFSGEGISVTDVTHVSNQELKVTLDIAADAAFGNRDVTVENPDGGAATLSGAFTVTHGAPAALALKKQPVGGRSGEELLTQPVVEVRDAYGNVATGDDTTEVSVALKPGEDGSLGGATSVTVKEGVASFTDLTLTGEVGEAYVLRFSAGGLTPVDSEDVTLAVGPPDPARTLIDASASTVQADGETETTITVQVRDADDNNALEGGAAVVLTTSAGTLGPVEDHDDGAYTATLRAPLYAGTATITGTLNGEAITDTAAVEYVLDVAGYVFADGDSNGARSEGEGGPGSGPLYVKLLRDGAAAYTAPDDEAGHTFDYSSGEYRFSKIAAGEYSVIVTSDPGTSGAGVSSSAPAGWIGVRALEREIHVADSQVALPGVQRGPDFALFHGSRVSGSVFRDDGAGGGAASDGRKSGGEAGPHGMRVRVLEAGGTLLATTLTDAVGGYTLFIPAGAVDPEVSLSLLEVGVRRYVWTGATQGESGVILAESLDDHPVVPIPDFIPGVAYAGFDVGITPRLAVDGSRNGVAPRGGRVALPFTLHLGSKGDMIFAPVASPRVWDYAYFRDVDGNGRLGVGDTIISGPVEDVGPGPLHVLLRVQVPTEAPEGAADTPRIAAQFTHAGNPALTEKVSLDLFVTVSSGELALEIEVRNVTRDGDAAAFTRYGVDADTGDLLEYRVTYTNKGTGLVEDVVVRLPVPVYTSLIDDAYGSDAVKWVREDGGVETTSGTLIDQTLVVDLGATTVAAGERGSLFYRVIAR